MSTQKISKGELPMSTEPETAAAEPTPAVSPDLSGAAEAATAGSVPAEAGGADMRAEAGSAAPESQPADGKEAAPVPEAEVTPERAAGTGAPAGAQHGDAGTPLIPAVLRDCRPRGEVARRIKEPDRVPLAAELPRWSDIYAPVDATAAAALEAEARGKEAAAEAEQAARERLDAANAEYYSSKLPDPDWTPA